MNELAQRELTLGIHEVGDGDGVAALDLSNVCVEHDVGAALGASAEILLAELVDLGLDGGALLYKARRISIVLRLHRQRARGRRLSYQLLLERDLLELHLVNSGLRGASEGGRGDDGGLHDGRSGVVGRGSNQGDGSGRKI